MTPGTAWVSWVSRQWRDAGANPDAPEGTASRDEKGEQDGTRGGTNAGTVVEAAAAGAVGADELDMKSFELD